MSTRCSDEPLLGCLNVLLHADDTLVLSTSKEKFIHKCNLVFEFFENENLSLNMSKSGYMIFNPKANDIKHDLVIRNKILTYVHKQNYLGGIYTDNGNISTDIN